jgi:hypothetical protein
MKQGEDEGQTCGECRFFRASAGHHGSLAPNDRGLCANSEGRAGRLVREGDAACQGYEVRQRARKIA